MELPKNITQIGEVGRDCKVYVEDYVVSYLKQLNGPAGVKQVAAALYGKRRTENGVTYYFLYGACRLELLQTETRHLSQAQIQEIERLRMRFFPEQDFLGYRILNGEMIEGFHIREQEICRYIPGYAQFYEKNDGMLAYMLSIRDEIQPEQFDQAKYDEVHKRQEERRAASERVRRTSTRQRDNIRRMPRTSNVRYLKTTAVCVFALLCLLGLVSLQDGASADTLVQTVQTAGETLNQITAGETLTMEPKLDEALLEENQAETSAAESAEESVVTESETAETESSETETEESETAETESSETETEESETAETESSETETEESETAETESPETETEPAAVAYVICSGDTLSAISLRQYGNENHITELCEYNGISDPDDIKEGQVIMLPQ